MKKSLVMCLAMLICIGFLTAAVAQEKEGYSYGYMTDWSTARNMSFEGTVLSHDVACHCVVVKTTMGELVLQDDYAKFDQEYNRLVGLKIGSMVKGEYKTIKHINYATWIAYK
jgi:hypothetical protein